MPGDAEALALERITRNVLEDFGETGMAAPWSKARTAQHYARYPVDDKAERNRLAQAQYRQRTAKRRASVRAINNILMRQAERADDISRIAAALRAALTPDGIAALRRQLGR